MKALKAPIDCEGLERELHESLRADELYSLQNDAKIRAIEQAVPTYEDFREMVNAAHLKPLDREDMIPNVGVKWNSLASDKSSKTHDQGFKKPPDQQSPQKISLNVIPKNTHEFRQAWKRLVDHSDKFRLLNDTRNTLSKEIFRSEIPPDILLDSIITCLECLNYPGNEILIVDILITLSECNRFNLAVAFMSASEKSLCKELFRALHHATVATNKSINNLEKKYLP